MKIGILGPTNVDKFCKILKMKRLDYQKHLDYIAKLISGSSIVIVPHKGSVQNIFVEYYRKHKGKEVIGVIPTADVEFGIDFLDADICDDIIDATTWRNVPEKLCEESNIFICVGLGAGSCVEICQTKWFKVEKVYIIKELITSRLPEEVTSKLDVEYVSFEELKEIMKEQ